MLVWIDLAYLKYMCMKNNPALAKHSPFNPTVTAIQVRKEIRGGEN